MHSASVHIELMGTFSWSPNNKDVTVALISLRNGKINKVEPSTKERVERLSFPSSDVLYRLSVDRYYSSSKFAATSFIGMVDAVAEVDNEEARLMFEDSVGYLGVDVTGIGNAGEFVKTFRKGTFVEIAGRLEVCPIDDEQSALVCMGKNDKVLNLPKDLFKQLVENMNSVSKDYFICSKPEVMDL